MKITIEVTEEKDIRALEKLYMNSLYGKSVYMDTDTTEKVNSFKWEWGADICLLYKMGATSVKVMDSGDLLVETSTRKYLMHLGETLIRNRDDELTLLYERRCHD